MFASGPGVYIVVKTETLTQINSGENQIVVYQPDETIRLDVRLENETVWLTQEQMSLLFGRTQPVIARHIGNIFREGELDREVVYAKFAYTTRHGAIAGKTQTEGSRLEVLCLRKARRVIDSVAEGKGVRMHRPRQARRRDFSGRA